MSLTLLFRSLFAFTPPSRIVTRAAYINAAASTNLARGFFAQGDTIEFDFPIYASDTTPAVLTAPTGVYAIADSALASSVRFARAGIFSESNGLWTMRVSLAKGDTGALPAGILYEQVSVQDTDGSNEMVFAGPLRVIPSLSAAVIAAGL